jgi:hypothetical protein
MMKEILERLARLERLFLEIIRDDCEEPDVVDLIFSHTQKKMGGKISLDKLDVYDHWRARWWIESVVHESAEPNIYVVGVSPIKVLRHLYEAWREQRGIRQPAKESL